MERKEITDSYDWNALIQHVVEDQATVEIARNDVPLALISPVKPPMSMTEFKAFMDSLPSLGDDAESFARDVERVREEMPSERDPWES
jgi:hypothetical protein